MMLTSVASEQQEFLDGRVVVLVGDITLQAVEAIVNAANPSLLGGGGVDGAIHRAGGLAILNECREIRETQYPSGLPVGEAVITTAGELSARYVIHTAGPIYGKHRGHEAELLTACYENSLQLAASHALQSLAFPAISTGIYGYPRSEAAAIASETIEKFLTANNLPKEVRLVFFAAADLEVFLKNQRFKRGPL